MTATDPRPALAAALAARLAPAAEALAAAYAEDASPEPPPPAEPDDVGSQDTPGFHAWLEDLERRRGPAPLDRSRPGGLLNFSVGTRKFVGRTMTPEFRAWDERQRRRTHASYQRSRFGTHTNGH